MEAKDGQTSEPSELTGYRLGSLESTSDRRGSLESTSDRRGSLISLHTIKNETEVSVVDFPEDNGDIQEKAKAVYATKKLAAKGLLDICLLTANASQLKTLLTLGPGQDYYHANLALISISIILQIVVGILLLIHGKNKQKTTKQTRSPDTLNDVIVGFLFAITVINVFIAAFGIKQSEH